MKGLHVGFVGVFLMAAALSGCLGGGGSAEAIKADFAISPQSDAVFLFDASNSTGDLVDYAWNFGDGTLVAGDNRKVEMEYTISGAKPWVSLVVTAANGEKAAIFKQVTLGSGENSAPEVHATQTPRWVTPGTDVVLDISGTDDHDGDGFTTEWFLGPFQDPAPPEAALDTGLLAQGESFNQTFSEEGVYFIHCHPHPWMTGRIVVDSSAESSNSTLEISNFAYNKGEDFVVSPGTDVTIVNLDPIPHTATNYFAAPGAKKQTDASGKTFRVTGLDAGDYQAFAVVDDKKPGFAGTYSWGIRFSDDAPTIDFEEPVASGMVRTQADDASSTAFPSALEYPANITAELTYNALPVGASWTFEIAGPTPITGQCASGSCTAIGNLEPGDYSFEYAVVEGGVSDWTLSVKSFTYYTNPGFGDPAAGGDDPHAHH